jgi:hypothetical protein
VEAPPQAVLDAWEQYPTSTVATLYDPLLMPAPLVKAHQQLDRAVDRFYHRHLKGMDCYILRVGDYRVVCDFDQSKGVLHTCWRWDTDARSIGSRASTRRIGEVFRLAKIVRRRPNLVAWLGK